MNYLILGPMFSSKTTTLLTKLERASIAKKRVVLLRPNTDNRGFLSHSNKDIQVQSFFIDNLLEFDIFKYDVIGIDEGQFHKHLKDFCIKASKAKKMFMFLLYMQLVKVKCLMR